MNKALTGKGNTMAARKHTGFRQSVSILAILLGVLLFHAAMAHAAATVRTEWVKNEQRLISQLRLPRAGFSFQ